MKHHNETASGKTYFVECVDNGFLITTNTISVHRERVFYTIEELVNDMVREFHLVKIGETVRMLNDEELKEMFPTLKN
jgi:hypothetical protein